MGLSFFFSESTLISLSWLSSLSFDRVITLLSSDLLFLLNFQAIGITADPSGKGVVFITKRTKCKWTLSSWYQCSFFHAVVILWPSFKRTGNYHIRNLKLKLWSFCNRKNLTQLDSFSHWSKHLIAQLKCYSHFAFLLSCTLQYWNWIKSFFTCSVIKWRLYSVFIW